MPPRDSTYWNKLAHDYKYLGPPLCPSGDDVRAAEQVLAEMRSSHAREALRVLLCGVTPELGRMNCPPDTRLLAVEQAQAMIRAVWPGDRPGERWAVQGNWLALPAAGHAQHVVLADGCFNTFEYPAGYHAYAAALHQALRPDGLLHARIFVQPARREEPGEVLDALRAGKVASFHHFKLRLFMAVQRATFPGVVVGDVYQAWADAAIDPRELAARTGWPEGVVKTIAAYQDNSTRLSFPTIEEARAALHDSFQEISMRVLEYELGERCPILTLRPRPG
jgi:hypothetical protein